MTLERDFSVVGRLVNKHVYGNCLTTFAEMRLNRPELAQE